MMGCAPDAPEEPPPLQPLIYTEYPDLTPQGAAVRERRLKRQLVEGISEGDWGRLEQDDEATLPRFDEPQALGEAIVEALLERRESLWEHTFISSDDYADLVGVGDASAREFVDNQIGKSLPLWKLFSQRRSSEMPEGGLSERFEFVELKLGSSRTREGAGSDEDSEIVQYWNNQIVLRNLDAHVEFELSIPRIFRIHGTAEAEREPPPQEDADEPHGGDSIFRVGSEIEVDPTLRTFLDVGLHLKPQLLRPQEYPFPMGVGSFWRYRRYDADEGIVDDGDPLDRRLDEGPQGLAAEEVIVEVREVSRYGPIRLVELLRAYDDRTYTRVRQWWVLTPRRIYDCDSSCREQIDDIGWMLGYFERQVPLMTFPLRRDLSWAEGGRTVDGEADFSVHHQWHEVQTPAGTFARAYRIEGRAALGSTDPYVTGAGLVRYFAPDRGVISRHLTASEQSKEDVDVIEELVEYRLMD